jgi:hypothetical protein
MHNHLLDIKVGTLAGFYFVVSFADFEIFMKIAVFIVTIGYTIRRWYLLEKNKKDVNG